jgi:hypothetical protein
MGIILDYAHSFSTPKILIILTPSEIDLRENKIDFFQCHFVCAISEVPNLILKPRGVDK